MLNDSTHVRPRKFFPRNLAFLPMRIAIPVIAVCLMAAMAAFASPVAAGDDQQTSSWYFNDNPSLEGAPGGWFAGTSGGYRSDYHYTYGIGNSDQRDNYAVWNMGHRHGIQWVWVWVPSSPADVRANVSYRIYRNDTLYRTVSIDQGESKGWQYLGHGWFSGADVRIEVWDNETDEHYNPRNPVNSRIGIDAVAMKCFWACKDVRSGPAPDDIRKEGNSVSKTTLSTFYEGLYDSYLKQTPYRDQCDDADLGGGSSYNWLLTTGFNSKGRTGYSFILGECTSWVQFRLRATAVVPDFHNGYKYDSLAPGGAPWQDANTWDEKAKRIGYLRPGLRGETQHSVAQLKHSVAQWNSGGLGHVAFVEDVSADGNTIWVSEMNNGDHQICYLSVRAIKNSVTGTGVFKWPDNFIVFSPWKSAL